MAKEQKAATPEGEEAGEAPKSKKGLVLGGGIVGVIALAGIVSMVALPGRSEPPPFDGPFVTPLSAGDVQVNLKGSEGRRYLVMSVSAEYEGYDEAYAQARIADAVYITKQNHALISLGRQKTMADVADKLGEEAFCEEVREAIGPLLFPIHVGNEEHHAKQNEESGLAPGRSIQSSTMRGGYRAHVIRIDAPKGTAALDEGPLTDFDGSEVDLELVNENGLTVFVDTTGVEPEFVGEVHVGAFGRVRAILFQKFITQ